MSNLDKKMNAENLEGYETSKTLLYCEALLGLIQSYILNFNGKMIWHNICGRHLHHERKDTII